MESIAILHQFLSKVNFFFSIVYKLQRKCLGPPDPPSGKPSVIAEFDTASISWCSSPYDGGKVVTGFAVEHSLLGSDVWITTEVNHSFNYQVRGLQPGAQYVFRIRAINVHGCSKPGIESDHIQMKELGNYCRLLFMFVIRFL